MPTFDPDVFGGDASGGSGYDQSIFSTKNTIIDKPKEKPESVSDFSGNLRLATPFGTLDTRIPLPQFVNKGLAQFGSGMADYGMVTASPDAVDAKRELDKPLTKGFAGTALNLGGKVGPALAIPMVGGPIVGGIAAGSAMGALEPVGTGESRTGNVAIGGTLGGLLPGGIAAFKSFAKPTTTNAALAQSAQDLNIPLGVADITNSKFLKGARSLLNDLPFIGSIGDGQKIATQQGFNRAIGNTFGADATSLTPQVMKDAKDRIVSNLNKAWDNPMDYNANLFGTFRKTETLAQDLPALEAKKLTGWIKDLESKVVQDPNGRLTIPGQTANSFQSKLRELTDTTQGMAKNELNTLRQDFLGEFNTQLGGDAGAALTKARQQYRAFKTVEPIINGAEAGVAGRVAGDVPAALLPQRIVQQYGSSAKSPFGELPQIGSQFLVNRTPQTGGSIRAAIQNGLIATGLGGSGVAGGAAVAGGLGALLGGGATLGGAAAFQQLLGSPVVVRALYNNPSAVRGLLESPDMKKTLLELSKKSGLLAAPGLGLGNISASAFE